MPKLSKNSLLFVLLLIGLATSFHAYADDPGNMGPITVARHTSHERGPAGFAIIAKDELPREGQMTLELIKQGGPFNYRKDGTAFQNREKRLPVKPKGYYREFTVPTPGVAGRGARRIVAGSNGEFYYTDDHYRTFKLIKE